MGNQNSSIDEMKLNTLKFMIQYFTSAPCFFIQEENVSKAMDSISRCYTDCFYMEKIDDFGFQVKWKYLDPGHLILKQMKFSDSMFQNQIYFVEIEGTGYFAVISNEYESLVPYYLMGIIRDQIENCTSNHSKIPTYDLELFFEIVEDYKNDLSISYLPCCIDYLMNKWFHLIVNQSFPCGIEFEDCLLYGGLRNSNMNIRGKSKIQPKDYISVGQKILYKHCIDQFGLKSLLSTQQQNQLEEMIQKFHPFEAKDEYIQLGHLFYEHWRKEWCLEIKELDWNSYDTWSINPPDIVLDKTKTIQYFYELSKSSYCLGGGIEDNFCYEGGINLIHLCKGPEPEFFVKMKICDQLRVDLRGKRKYFTGTRALISCWNIISLAYVLNKFNYDLKIIKELHT